MSQGSRDFPYSTWLTVLLLGLLGKLAWDLSTIIGEWPEPNWPRFGICTVLPVLMFGLYRGRQWALNLFGVVCIFWVTYVVAHPVMKSMTIGSEDLPPFPWTHLIALPGILFVLNNLRTDEEMRQG